MNKRYVKTPAGHAEIQSKTLALSRPVRNLLLVINDSQPGEVWLQQIRGLAGTDLTALLDAGLIAETAPPGAAVARPARRPDGSDSSPADTVPGSLTPTGIEAATGSLQDAQQCIDAADYTPLYDTLTAQAKGQLGLLKGYRFTLEVERAADLAALRTLARRFAQGLHDDHGPAALRQFLDALRAAG
ncbi:hypothetical protein KGA65_18380 [Ideonella sp. B7]|uniref:hypothetical protein n=1 Tax=Ideonella benzenivorans TaxID=2831643 RepID=UPI001CECB5FC|nr:hypothetical protein [Ideonella benzenivorans]MCA6218510.1 hypothetical protein [Ideonella benzenivorans]